MKKCKNSKITPGITNTKNKFVWTEFKREVIFYERKILRKLIKWKYAEVNIIGNKIDEHKQELEKIEPCIIDNILRKVNTIRGYENSKHKKKHNKKLNFWRT